MIYVRDVYNRRTKTDHLDLFIESPELDEYSLGNYKNIRWSEIMTIDLSQVKLKKEVEEIINNITDIN